MESAILQANLLPPELTAIRAVGLGLAVLIAGFAIWRRRSLRNADVLILLVIALGLAIVSGTELLDTILSAFSFKRSNGTRIVGVAVFAILILFLLVVRALAQGSRITRELSAAAAGCLGVRRARAGDGEGIWSLRQSHSRPRRRRRWVSFIPITGTATTSISSERSARAGKPATVV